MDTTPLQPTIRSFLDSQTTDPLILEQQGDHDRRKERAQQLLVRDRIPTLSRQELQDFLIDTDAYYGVRGREQLWINLFGQDDELLPTVRQALLDLVESAETELTASDFNAFCGALKGIGSAYASELLALRFPDRYWLWNGPIRQFLKDHDVDVKEELPWGKKGDEGEQYLAAGRHLADLRRALSEAAGQPVDYQFTDLFLYWANQQEAPLDPWADRIAQRLRRDMPPERLQARLDGEEKARTLLQENLGHFTEVDLRQCFKDFNTDWWEGKMGHRRFMPALYGNSIKGMVESLDAFNSWVRQLWLAEETDLDTILDDFWRLGEVTGAGISLPTAILYLRDPERYCIWLPIMSDALQVVADFTPGKFRTVEGYRHYNATAQSLRERYRISPQALDVILWWIAQPPPPRGDGSTEGEEKQVDPASAVYGMEDLCRDTYLDVAFWTDFEFLLSDKRQIILHGPPGTGKTWLARCFAKYWVDSASSPGGKVKVVQFHPSYAYEEFVEGIRPKSKKGKDGRRALSYPVQKGLFRRFCKDAGDHPQQRNVLILDEINRGELPRIFGELLYLLEYRTEAVTLPYSGDTFSIPPNVYLIGTMNTADRSIALVDHALRRRFHFFKLEPSPKVLRAFFEDHSDLDMGWTSDLLEMLNKQLEADGIEWHLHIGHSHFMRSNLSDRMLEAVWDHSILPTLEEHFYRQPQKLQAYKLATLRAALGDTG